MVSEPDPKTDPEGWFQYHRWNNMCKKYNIDTSEWFSNPWCGSSQNDGQLDRATAILERGTK